MSKIPPADGLTPTITLAPIMANIEYQVLKKLGKKSIRKFLSDRTPMSGRSKNDPHKGMGQSDVP
jgi:hypothetical protein